jgi:predicted ATP-dependent endonuclease of OLD family
MTRFRVQNFRNVDDSGWIPAEQVTALVGRNEAGKTAVLQALYKFNPATKTPYNPQREFPRERFTREYRADKRWPVASIDFAISLELQGLLREIAEDQEPPMKVVVTRNYDDSMDFTFEPTPKEKEFDRAVLDSALDKFNTGAMRLQPPTPAQPDQEALYQTIRTDLQNWVTTCRDRLAPHKNLKSPEGFALLVSMRNELNSKGRPETADLVSGLQESLTRIHQEHQTLPIVDRLKQEVAKHLPVFIYFENYGVLDSAVFLPRFLNDLKTTPHDPKCRTINAMFRHVNLSADEITELGHTQSERQQIQGQQAAPEIVERDRERKELRSIKLSSASNDITERFSAWWKQRRHKVRYEADGDFFRIWVSDDRRPHVDIELESRSRGFQWFFSFYLVFLVESEDGHKDAVLLLDEPGLHLHPTAQEELIAFFEELAQKNQLIYTTHSPWLVDGEHLSRVRPVTEDEKGHSHISVGEWPSDRETIFPLQGAAGYAMVRALFQHRKNVLVEGMSDYFYLHALSLLCRQANKTALPEDIYITPCGGTKLMGHLASLFLGQKVRPLVLLDGDDAGRVRRDALLKELYTGHEKAVLMLDEVLGASHAEIEDVIGEKNLLPVLNDLLPRKLSITREDRTKDGLVEHIKAAAIRHALQLPEGWKAEVARRIAANWSLRQSVDVPPTVLDDAEKVFAAICERFAEFNQQAV